MGKNSNVMKIKVEDISFPNSNEFFKLALYQRTELLPLRNKDTLFNRIIAKIGFVPNENYKEFVKRVSDENSESIAYSFFKIFEKKAISLLPHITTDCSSILDIGCGLGVLDLFLWHELNKPKLYLLDKTWVDENIWYLFTNKAAFYNSLELTNQFLVRNDVTRESIRTLNASDDFNIPIKANSVDLIVSSLSWGFHYPLSTYMDGVQRVLREDGIIIVDTRKGTGAEQELKKNFKTEIIEETGKVKTFKCSY